MKEWEISSNNTITPRYLTPIGFNALCHIRECPLRFAFSRDTTYPQKVHPKARMAVALHETLALFSIDRPSSLSEAIAFFHLAMSKQREQALSNYRERWLSWPRTVREAMENALAARFRRSSRIHSRGTRHHVETTLVSHDNLVIGRPDELLRTEDGCIIVDYKTARSTDEAVDSAEAQIHFYAGLWQETHKETSVGGRIEFLLDNRQHSFPIEASRADSLVSEARSYAQALHKSIDWLFEPSVGAHCHLCDYRPWCADYWRSLNLAPVAQSRDIDGLVCAAHPRDSSVICVVHDTLHVAIVNRSVEPLSPWAPGTRIRALDLEGTDSTRFRVTHSELFWLSSKPGLINDERDYN